MLSRFFIERPIFANVLAIVTIILGLVALFQLPVSQYPEITPPTVQVTHQLPRRECPDRCRHRGPAHRAAGERGGRHALYAVDQQQRRYL